MIRQWCRRYFYIYYLALAGEILFVFKADLAAPAVGGTRVVCFTMPLFCLSPMFHAIFEYFCRQAFYSTPQQYTEAKHASGVHLSVKKDDFFPYADCPVRRKNYCLRGNAWYIRYT